MVVRFSNQATRRLRVPPIRCRCALRLSPVCVCSAGLDMAGRWSRPAAVLVRPRAEPQPEPLATAEPGVATPAAHADAESAPEPSVSDAPAPKASTPETPASDVRASEAATVEVQAAQATVSRAAETPVAPAAHPRRSAGGDVAAHAPPEVVA